MSKNYDMPDLKEVLMELGNRLVLDHGFAPAYMLDQRTSTHPIHEMTCWLNEHAAARAVLADLGYRWSMLQDEQKERTL